MNYICGTYFKHLCRYRFGDYSSAAACDATLKTDKRFNNKYVFVKTELLDIFIHRVRSGEITIPDNFSLFTHNSDINWDQGSIDAALLNLEEDFPTLNHWYAQNLNCHHLKASPLPIGIANPKWAHGNPDTFDRVIKKTAGSDKNKEVFINFNINTNFNERSHCLEELQTTVNTLYPRNRALWDDFVDNTHEEYLTDIADSLFIISPNGNGIDCHRHWESLYLKTIPIVSRSILVERFRDMGVPFLILDKWSDFHQLELTKDLYTNLWGSFNPQDLTFDFFSNS